MSYYVSAARYEYAEFSELKSKTIASIEIVQNNHLERDQIIFTTIDNEQYIMFHDQDCCESVTIEDIIGNIDDLIGSEILEAEEVTNSDDPLGKYADSFTWTFYKLATIKGYVTIRWFGESNGYYSESVSFYKIE